jgi:hypothetical protein
MKAAGLLGWPDTFDAEYVALTQLHAVSSPAAEDTVARRSPPR